MSAWSMESGLNAQAHLGAHKGGKITPSPGDADIYLVRLPPVKKRVFQAVPPTCRVCFALSNLNVT